MGSGGGDAAMEWRELLGDGRTGGQRAMRRHRHPPSRQGQLPANAELEGWTSGQAIEVSCVHQKSVPSVQMQCRMTASLRATATLAFLAPTRFISRTPQAFSGDQRLTLVSSTPAAS